MHFKLITLVFIYYAQKKLSATNSIITWQFFHANW